MQGKKKDVATQILNGIGRSDSWSVECLGQAYDDARRFRSQWYYRDPISKKFEPLPNQNRIVPLFRNPQFPPTPLG